MKKWSVKKKLFSVLVVVILGFICLLLLNEWAKSRLLMASAEKDASLHRTNLTNQIKIAMGEAQRSASDMLVAPDNSKAEKVFASVKKVNQTLGELNKSAKDIEERKVITDLLSLTETYNTFFSGVTQIEESLGHLGNQRKLSPSRDKLKELENKTKSLKDVGLLNQLLKVESMEGEYLIDSAKNNRAEMKQAVSELAASLKASRQNDVAAVAERYGQYYDSLVYTLENQKVMVGMYQDAARKVDPLVAKIQNNASTQYMEALKQETATNDAMRWLPPIISLAILILLMLFMLYINRGIQLSIQDLLRFASSLKKGDLREQQAVRSFDEFGLLTATFNEVSESLRVIIDSLNKDSQLVNDSSANLTTVFHNFSAQTQEVTGSIESIANHAFQQKKLSETSVNLIKQWEQHMESMTEQNRKTEEKVGEQGKVTEAGLNAINHLQEVTNTSYQLFGQIGHYVEELHNKSKNIEQITGVISEISEQTNLLALNASIEAARAGEAGKGFSIVAEEVRRLAEQSRTSALEIQQFVADIKQQVEQAVSAVNSAGTQFQQQRKEQQKTRDVFEVIECGIQSLKDFSREMGASVRSMNEQKAGLIACLNRMDQSSEQMAESTAQLACTSENQMNVLQDIATSSDKLRNIADSLVKQGRKFVL